MAINNPNREQPNNNSVDAAEDLLAEMKQRAEDAHSRGDTFMLNVLTEILKVTSPIVTKAIARHHREERARINELAAELRKKTHEEREQKREAKRANARD